jgi:F-type H+-transporting ATPase subunit delta
MSKISRRSLARYAVDELLSGRSSAGIAKELAATLTEDGKTGEVEFLVGDIAWELERRGELAVGTVTSATKLTSQLMDSLASQIKKATGTKQVLLNEEVDKSVIGGLRVETSGRVWDATISRKLSRIREAF